MQCIRFVSAVCELDMVGACYIIFFAAYLIWNCAGVFDDDLNDDRNGR